ncbi:MAG: DNA-binding protein [Candidatus Aenigmatarchaeota archaeon]
MTELTPEEMKQLQEFEMMKKTIIRKILTKDAIERMGRIRMVKPDLATQLELYLIQLYKEGQIRGVIDDQQLRKLLDILTSKREFRLKR